MQISGHQQEHGIFGETTGIQYGWSMGKKGKEVKLVSQRGQVLKCFANHANQWILFLWNMGTIEGSWKTSQTAVKAVPDRDDGGLIYCNGHGEQRGVDRLGHNQEAGIFSLFVLHMQNIKFWSCFLCGLDPSFRTGRDPNKSQSLHWC